MMTMNNTLSCLALVLSVSDSAPAEQPHSIARSDPPRKRSVCGDHVEHPATVVDTIGVGFAGGFRIDIDYTNSGFSAAQQVVFDAAIQMWEDVIAANGGSGVFTITDPAFTDIGSALGRADNYVQDGNGIPISARIQIDSDYSWFVDPTPFDNSEFTPVGDSRFWFNDGQGNASYRFDLLTVLLHEIGHGVGWAASYSRFSAVTSDGPGGRRTFDSGGFPITLVAASDGTHADPGSHPGELMIPTIAPGVRKLISYFPTMTAPQRAYDYSIPLLTFIRAGYAGAQSGTAGQPFGSMHVGLSNARDNGIVIIKQGSYAVPTPYSSPDKALTLWPVLGSVHLTGP